MSHSGLLVVGSVALDTVRTPHGSVERALGGSAVHFAAAARFFSPVRIVGVVGEDFPDRYLTLLKRLGIHTDALVVTPGEKTFHWKGRYDGDMNQAITEKTELNAFAAFRPALSTKDASSPYLFLANIHPRIQLDVLRQIRAPRWTACDTMNYWIRNEREPLIKVLKNVQISFMNDAEIRELSGYNNLFLAARWVQKLGPRLVLIKKGEHGVFCLSGGRRFLFPAYLLEEVVDPTGAGDSFAGAFLGYLAKFKKPRERDIKNAVARGVIVASFNVQKFSMDRLITLTIKDMTSRLKTYERMISL